MFENKEVMAVYLLTECFDNGCCKMTFMVMTTRKPEAKKKGAMIECHVSSSSVKPAFASTASPSPSMVPNQSFVSLDSCSVPSLVL